jgi:hypothetical protein
VVFVTAATGENLVLSTKIRLSTVGVIEKRKYDVLVIAYYFRLVDDIVSYILNHYLLLLPLVPYC